MASNYFTRHWRGEHSLAVSYWVNGALLGNLFGTLIMGVAKVSDSGDFGTLRMSAGLSLAAIAVSMLAYAWAVVGIWRSASNHVARGGRAFWAGLAKFMVLIGLLGVLGNYVRVNLAGQVRELAAISLGHDPLGQALVKVSADGRTVLLHGGLGEGTSATLRRTLDASPGVQLIELNSPGGRLYEGRAIAKEVRTRGLNTYVEKMCASACTVIFLAGKDRGATPNARIGFHRPSFAGVDDTRLPGNQRMMDDYRSAGISDAFIQRVQNTASGAMWFPTRDELLANHVVTRVSLGGESSHALTGINSKDDLLAAFKALPLWATIEARFPGTLARATELAWSAKQRGANDGAVLSAGRSVLSDLMPKALATAPDDKLLAFMALLREEMAAALALSPQACAQLLAGQLNVSAVLPKALVEKEAVFTQDLFAAVPRTDLPFTDQRSAQQALARAMEHLSPAQIEVVRAPERFNNDPQRLCTSLIAFYGQVEQLPVFQRRLVLRLMYQSGP